ncbi:MAG: hypothetical protein ACW986_09475 [Promethearchaeota archaeon]|jgi:hypothetical protein
MSDENIDKIGKLFQDFLEKLQAKLDNFHKISISSEDVSVETSDEINLESEKINVVKTNITRSEILKEIKEVLENAQSRVLLTVPSVVDLEDLQVYSLKSSTHVDIACYVDFSLKEHREIVNELEHLGNIYIRNYVGKDRWSILRDGEELICVAEGEQKNNYLFFHTSDRAHIRIFTGFPREPWFKGRKI